MTFTRTDSYYTNKKDAENDKLIPGVMYVLNQAMQDNLKLANKIDEKIRKYNLENSQEYLDWQDSLNDISVR